MAIQLGGDEFDGLCQLEAGEARRIDGGKLLGFREPLRAERNTGKLSGLKVLTLLSRVRLKAKWTFAMNREEKLGVFKEAVKLADSGKYKSWKQIQSRLVKSGHKRAPELLDGNKIRMILDAQCKLARR